MFYVAFLLKPRKNVVIPLNWVFQHEKQLPKFVNSGLNANQKHRLFFSENWRENDGLIQNYNADFDVDGDEFPNECCYEGNLIKFFANYDVAETFAKNRRTYKPALYNEDRLVENPIPLLNTPNSVTNETDDAILGLFENDANGHALDEEEISELNEAENSVASGVTPNDERSNDDIEHIEINGINLEDASLHTVRAPINAQANQNDPLNEAEVNNLIITETPNEIETPTEAVGGCVKPEEVLIVEPSPEIMNALDGVIEEPEYIVHVVDGMEITVCNKVGYGRPFHVTVDELVKRENDIISGNISFNETRFGSRLYGLGTYKLEIPEKVVATFKQWNTHSHKQNEEYDRRFVQALVLLVANIETGSIKQQDILELIKGMMNMVRSGNDDERTKFMTNLAEEELEKPNAA